MQRGEQERVESKGGDAALTQSQVLLDGGGSWG